MSRLARILLRLSALDEKIARGEGTDFDLKCVGGLDSALRNGLARLGFKAAQPKRRSLAEILVDLDPRTETPA